MTNIDMNLREKDFYFKLRKQIHTWLEKNLDKENHWAEFILLAPDLFHLLCKLTLDDQVPRPKKVKLGAAIAYFITPFDIIPEALLGPIGYLDDVAVAAYILNDIINNVDPKIVRRNWAGDKDILNIVKTILINADKIVGSGIWRKIQKRF